MSVDRWFDQLAVVVELAAQNEDRSDMEQRCLLRVAVKVDSERGKQTDLNAPHWVAPYLEQMVDRTRVLGDGQRLVRMPSEVKAAKR